MVLLVVCVAVLAVGALASAEPSVIIHFHGAPPKHSRFTDAVFQYSVQRPDGGNACKKNACSFSCEVASSLSLSSLSSFDSSEVNMRT